MLEQENKQTEQPRSKRGFAAMSPEKRRQIASKGGQTAHQKGAAHKFNSQEAKVAGSKGGSVVSRDRRYMSEIGRKGGRATAKKLGYGNDENSAEPEER